MVDKLTLFLTTEELDLVEQFATQLLPLNPEDEQAVEAVLDRWDDPQAVANLLLHPELIPTEKRKGALLRGLDERLTYTTLAALVGLQNVQAAWTDHERSEIVNRVLAIIYEARPVLANRASVTLLRYANQTHIEKLIFLLGYPGDVVQHNALIALVRLLGEEKARERIEVAYAEKRVTEAGLEFAAAHVERVKDENMPLLSYIPNRTAFQE